jgi:nucleotide-binding universal stress UspA family protein
MKLILVATDFSKAAAQALRYASAIADRKGARLLVIYADEFIPPLNETTTELTKAGKSVDELVAAVHEQLIAHVEANVSSYVPFVARIVVGDVAASIVTQAKDWDADLIVMGTHGRNGLRRLLVGSVCEAVLRTASIPVIAVNSLAADHPTFETKKIVCVVDYSPECAEALRIAAELAPDARIVLVKPEDGGRDPHGGDRVAQLRRWLPVDLVGRCELRLAGAFTPQHVADFARLIGGDLIAAGFKTTGGLGDVLFGTTTDRIVQHSECPVLVVNASAVREREQLVLAGAGCTCDA